MWEHLLEALRGETEPVCTLSGWVSQNKGMWHPILLSRACVKNPPAMRETWVPSLGQEDPWRREWQPTPVFWPGEFRGQRGLAATVHSVAKS